MKSQRQTVNNIVTTVFTLRTFTKEGVIHTYQLYKKTNNQ